MNTALNSAMGIAAIDFGTYLRSDAKHIYTLNLANKSLLECIDERVKQKERLHPSFGKNMSCLKANIRELENEYASPFLCPYYQNLPSYNLFNYPPLKPTHIIFLEG